MRVTILLIALGAVLIYAADDVLRRHRRTAWKHPLRVGLVIVRRAAIDPAAMEALPARLLALEERLGAEYARYRGAMPRPLHFVVLGPVDEGSAPPQLAGDGLGAAAKWRARPRERSASPWRARASKVGASAWSRSSSTRRWSTWRCSSPRTS